MTSMLLLFILICMLAGGFFAACETVLVSASKARLHQRWEENREKKAFRSLQLMERMEMIMGTTLLGTNLMMVTATTLASWLLAETLSAKGLQGDWANLLNMLVMTPLILVISELTPKTIGRLHADQLIVVTASILRFFQFIFYPAVSATSRFGRACAMAFGGPQMEGQIKGVTREDLQAMAIAAAEHGIVDEAAGNMIRTVFELAQRTLGSVMVPLVDVVALPENADVEQLADTAARTGFTRFPIYRGRIDEVVGIVNLRQVMYGIGKQWQATPQKAMKQPITPFVDYKLLIVPESKSVDSLLHELRYREQPMAIIVDEHGGVTGIATTEDLVEELVGEIRDERDKETGKLTRVTESVYDCDGKLEIRDLATELKLEIDNDGFATVAGLVLKLAGRIPRSGERFHYQNYEIEVLEVVGRRIVKLRFRKITDEK